MDRTNPRDRAWLIRFGFEPDVVPAEEEGEMAGKKKSGTPSEKKARAARPPKAPKKRVAGLPAAGSVIKREYGGKTHEVRVNQEDFTYNGDRYSSLTSVALKITGYKAISGPVFFKKALAARASDEA